MVSSQSSMKSSVPDCFGCVQDLPLPHTPSTSSDITILKKGPTEVFTQSGPSQDPQRNLRKIALWKTFILKEHKAVGAWSVLTVAVLFTPVIF